VSEQQAAPPQFSPDGRWWWNGQEWVPAVPAGRGRSTVKIVLAVVAGAHGPAGGGSPGPRVTAGFGRHALRHLGGRGLLRDLPRGLL